MNSKHILQKTSILIICALICTALWGSAFPCIKIGYQLFDIASSDTSSQMLFAGIRFFFAGILTILIGSVSQKKILVPSRPLAASLPKILILALFQTIIQYFLFYVGLAHTTAIKGSILGGTSVLFSLLITCLIFKQEKMTSAKIAGCIIGFAGIIIVNLTGAGINMNISLLGDGFMILSSLSSAFSAVFLKHFSQTEHPVMLSGYQFALGGAVLAIAGKLMGGNLQFSQVTSVTPFLLLLYMALISAVAYSLWGLLLKYNPVSRVTVFGFTIQIFGVLLSALLLSESNSFGIQTMIALILVCAGIFLVNKGK